MEKIRIDDPTLKVVLCLAAGVAWVGAAYYTDRLIRKNRRVQ